jgi:hypothetical protein
MIMMIGRKEKKKKQKKRRKNTCRLGEEEGAERSGEMVWAGWVGTGGGGVGLEGVYRLRSGVRVGNPHSLAQKTEQRLVRN